MAEVCFKVDVPGEFKETFELALAKVVRQFIINLKFSMLNEISEIPQYDTREIKESVVNEVIESIEQTSDELKSGKRSPMTLEELDELMGIK